MLAAALDAVAAAAAARRQQAAAEAEAEKLRKVVQQQSSAMASLSQELQRMQQAMQALIAPAPLTLA